jgi:cytochrome c nitrite reductase small subunit
MRRLLLLLALLLGSAIGLGAFTFVYAKGGSYLSNEPGACANCHIMSEHFAAWTKASHHTSATCNDCHLPHSFIGKWSTKASNGFWHSFYFTTGRFPFPLRITPRNHKVTEKACRYCHAPIVDAIEHTGQETPAGLKRDEISCVRCHEYVGHWVR